MDATSRALRIGWAVLAVLLLIASLYVLSNDDYLIAVCIACLAVASALDFWKYGQKPARWFGLNSVRILLGTAAALSVAIFVSDVLR